MNLPVWMYWEGDCPEWIRACQQTIFAHFGDVCLLGPDEFDRLRTSDRDIDLSRLYVAHRADYARAFLLACYGGLWIDSDCLVMQPLQPILDILDSYDFLGHYERQGRISNGFIGARPGSEIAASYYRRVCEILRSGEEISWLSIGSMALSQALQEVPTPWYRLGYELIQPVCWSNPEKFFFTGSEVEHDQVYNERSVCYMLSNNNIRAHQEKNPDQDLMGENTFFTYLLKKAVGGKPITRPPRSSSMGTSNWQQIPFCVEAMLKIAPKRVLDVGIGFGRWGMLVREFCEEWQGRIHRENWQVWLEGIEVFPKNVEEYHHLFYDWVHIGDAADIIGKMENRWDLIIFGDVLDHWEKETALATLQKAMEISDYVLLNIPVGPGWELGPAYGNPYEKKRSFWQIEELLAIGPRRYSVFREAWGRDYATLIFSRSNPQAIKENMKFTGNGS